MSVTTASAEDAAKAAQAASRTLAVLPAAARRHALTAIHDGLAAARDEALAANDRDLSAAAEAVAAGSLSQSLASRLDLRRKDKWEDMLQGILDVRDLDDPIGHISVRTLLDDGLILERKSCPIGVLLIIFEARPEVIANITSLAIMSGNAAILKGGKESTFSFQAISAIVARALASTEVTPDAIQLVVTRDAVKPLLQLDRYIDLVIPRGSNALVQSIRAGTQIPVLGHADGLCTIYLCADYPLHLAVRVILDAKTGYPAACNAVETLLVDEAVLDTILPVAASALVAAGVELRCDPKSKAALTGNLEVGAQRETEVLLESTEADYRTEFLDHILAIKTVPRCASASDAVDLAISHINAFSSHHTDAILTASQQVAGRFQQGVDSSTVMWNTSTRMADGQRYGFGTEVGISTSKIHARGPVGLEGLTIYKWLLSGQGQVAADYGSGGRSWKHQKLPLLSRNS